MLIGVTCDCDGLTVDGMTGEILMAIMLDVVKWLDGFSGCFYLAVLQRGQGGTSWPGP